MPTEETATTETLEQLETLVFDDLEQATQSLPDDEKAAYEDARRSVVEARRAAETKEGLLRIC